jgi:hypothetical protein
VQRPSFARDFALTSGILMVKILDLMAGHHVDGGHLKSRITGPT